LPAAGEHGPATGAPPLLDALPIPAAQTGYVEAIDRDTLLTLAGRADVVLRLLRRPGDFIAAGRPLLEVSPASAAEPHLTTDCNAAFAVGRQRTPLQDLRFAIDELVEIASRALSPGVNDPFTAIACVDWLGAALSELALRGGADEVVCDGNGKPRLIAGSLHFEDYLASSFGQLRSYVAQDPNARARTLATLFEVANGVSDPGRRARVLAERERLERHPAD
jgi:uncharacterized membrane protein